MPDDIYANIDTDRWGNTITYEDVCKDDSCEQLDPDMADNIIGKAQFYEVLSNHSKNHHVHR